MHFRSFTQLVTVITLVATIAVAARSAVRADDRPAPAASRAEELFAHRVLRIFETKCFACHGSDSEDIRGEFNMLSREGLLRGGESGEPAIVPGQPADSPLLLAVQWESLQMPPKENDRLTAEQIGYIKDWIAGGAPWPNAERIEQLRKANRDQWDAADGVAVKTSGGLSDEWSNRRYKPEDLWAYQPLRKIDPKVFERTKHAEGQNVNPVDILIEARLNELGLSPAPMADRRTLIRRATFDLLGLPPTPEEIDAFVNDPSSDDVAWSTLIERLLGSPHYGEQWGRHWLDVVRYADSSGYANDYERGNAWRYRDYVIRAFNNDKPYDEFILEQIAGDEIAEREGASPEAIVATGFLRMGPWELTGMEVAKVARQRFLDDVTDTVGQVFLGHMLQCARCHDHKFDPVPTRDYYAMQAIFATTQLAERAAKFLPAESTLGFEERKYLDARLHFYEATLRALDAKQTIEVARAWYAENGLDPSTFEQALAELEAKPRQNKVTFDEVRNLLNRRNVDPSLVPPRHLGFEPRDYGLERIARKGIERLKWQADRYEPFALSVYSGRTPQMHGVYAPLRMPPKRMENGELEQTAILTGGDPFSPSQAVEPATLSAVQTLGKSAQLESPIPQDIAGRRTALARWIASEHNPLTARVMVNRIWQWHFGQPIAGTPNNFGATGKKPTHPELLDYLAGRFVDERWSIKAMHRLIMTSAAYRRSSEHPQPATLAEKDPEGTSYAAFRPRRLDAEELRDAMLSVSGEWNAAIGGIPVRPEMNLEAALQPRQVMGTFAEAWQPSPLPAQRHRRSIYALKLRGQRDPFAEVFNAPNSDLSCEAREASTVTPQVFALFNSPITFDRALALAKRVTDRLTPEETSQLVSRRQVIEQLFRITFGRTATADELDSCVEHWEKMIERHRKLTFERPEYPREVVREAVEENTGEKFSFVEPLEVYADFVADLKPCDASAELRGLAEVCLVLLNSNEFAYVY